MRRRLTRRLSGAFAVRCVATPDEARRLFAWDEFDAVVGDLPPSLGLDFLADVRRRMPRALRVLMSVAEGPDMPPADPPWEVLLRKPFRLDALLHLLERNFDEGEGAPP
ncbi:MAG TPA: hypothetical protein VM925_03720 [Labilithrix sp.]|nr:hypothetical protein [Labilithrix sp.]